MERPPWSNHQLRLGERLRDGAPPGEGAIDYDSVRLHYSDVAAEVQERIRAQDWRFLLGHRAFEVTSRAKTVDTTREKLQRDRATPLSRIQDLAGVRFEAEMSLSQQQAVAETIAQMFGAKPDEALHDLRLRPHSGYRAVHIWLRLPQRVEVQVRTHLQGAWANLYEEAGDYFGRGIRYGEVPSQALEAEVVQALQRVSLEGIEMIERLRDDLFHQELELDDERRAIQRRSRLEQSERINLNVCGGESEVLRKLEGQFEELRAGEHMLITQLEQIGHDLRGMAKQKGGG